MDASVEESENAVTDEERQRRARAERRARLRWPLMITGLLVATALGFWYYLGSGRYQATEDSAVEAAQTTISTNVPGRVLELDVRDNQQVRRGQVLFRLDPRTYQIAVQAAQAKLALARTQIRAAEATYRQRLTAVTAARAELSYAQTQFARQQRLVRVGISSRAQFDQAQNALSQAQQRVGAARQQVANALALLSGNPRLPVEQQPAVERARAALARARLNLSYTVVHAPSDGIVAKVEQLQVGDYVNASQPVFDLISTRDRWVEANFKETQLTYMRPGQSAQVTIDAYPGHTWHAHVASFSPGTGSQFSVLPPENATGNWVKVVQRVPVRVQLDPNQKLSALPLEAGMSANVTVDTRHQHSLFGLFSARGSAAGRAADVARR